MHKAFFGSYIKLNHKFPGDLEINKDRNPQQKFAKYFFCNDVTEGEECITKIKYSNGKFIYTSCYLTKAMDAFGCISTEHREKRQDY